jgi:trigger factor
MQISIETMGALERRLTISVDSETFEAEITKRLEQAGKKVRLPGFRPGKVPLKEVRRRFGPSIRAEVAGEFMQNSFVEAVAQEQLSPAGAPNLEVIKMDPGIDFEFTASFEVYPTVEVGDLSALRIIRPAAEITEADVDAMIAKLREQRKTFDPVDRPAQADDQVKVDFTGRLDGEVFEGGTGEDVQFVIGAGQMIESFEAGVTGHAKGATTTFDATFPEDYQAENLRGKTVQFEVTVKEVAQPRLPEMGEELFAAFGVTEGGEEAFRAEVESNMRREMDTAIKNQVTNQIMDQLADTHDVQLPKSMVRREIDALKAQMFQQMGMPAEPERLAGLPDDLFAERAERRVAVGLIVSEIVKQNDLSASPEKVRERIEEQASAYAEPAQVINYYYGNAEQLQQIEMAVLEDEVMAFIESQAEATTREGTYTQVIGGELVPKPEPAATEEVPAED